METITTMTTSPSFAQPYIGKDRVFVGYQINVRGILCRVTKIRPLGTIDVEQINGQRAFRLSGLSLVPLP